ncbi:hypothetical protein PGTUg99_011335 [Puccinia graminis f. sp. tritici]|uniref:Uncharacterized protein n=1 Tax=Puccinia graminis f. sp. tritici TaxID=56615 RepID=A0A5B0R4N2_PUCGR|nr:hypothetical protein PGTUg99_011335 [Puccinia graminis f. sp. tritici]
MVQGQLNRSRSQPLSNTQVTRRIKRTSLKRTGAPFVPRFRPRVPQTPAEETPRPKSKPTKTARRKAAPYPDRRPTQPQGTPAPMIHPDLAGQTEAAINTQPPPLSDDETDKSSESEESAQDDHSSPAEGGDESANLPSASSLTSRVNETPSMIASLQTTLGLSDTVVETVQQWASMTPQEHLVGITMYLESMNQQIQRLAPQSSVQDVPAPAPPAPAAPRAHVWHRDFRAPGLYSNRTSGLSPPPRSHELWPNSYCQDPSP